MCLKKGESKADISGKRADHQKEPLVLIHHLGNNMFRWSPTMLLLSPGAPSC